ncbi:conserved membrane hypothetical protein [Pseudomonas sp. 8Z]|uniref:hypothetical protein n=1 Tax=Pseudomonas sp. 8Z TaxID=2653166 RepID=UPI0012F3A9AF|nr:hypothetical protein [Pseudomonas sp. 8Z]VXC92516.1 conserved membrane hypothetical protein [Pseudomonas sp. 8Z]
MSESSVINPYSAPSSDLSPITNEQVSLDPRLALARGYDFEIGELLASAWRKTSGTKGLIWGGFLVAMGALIAAQIVVYIAAMIFGFGFIGLSAMGGSAGGGMAIAGFIGMFGAIILSSVVIVALMYPFLAGINMIGIRQAAGQPLHFAEIFSHFGRTLPLLVAGILMVIATNIGYMLLIVPGIYLQVALILTIALIVERRLSAWQAILVSCKAINQHWFKVFFLLLAMGILLFVSALPLGIGLIWTVPMFIVMLGELYQRIFGVLPAPAA